MEKGEEQYGLDERTFDELYQAERCSGSPADSSEVLQLGYKLWRSRYPRAVEQDEVENEIIRTFQQCSKYFNPSKGKQEVPVEKRFLTGFSNWFTRRLRRRLREGAKKGWRRLNNDYLSGVAEQDGRERRRALRHLEWSRFLFNMALVRFSKLAQQLIRLRYLDNMKPAAIARQVGVSSRTVSRYTGRTTVVYQFQRKVYHMVLSIPNSTLQKIVYILHYEEELTASEIARLLCLSPRAVEKIILSTAARIMAGLDAGRGMEMFAQAVEKG